MFLGPDYDNLLLKLKLKTSAEVLNYREPGPYWLTADVCQQTSGNQPIKRLKFKQELKLSRTGP